MSVLLRAVICLHDRGMDDSASVLWVSAHPEPLSLNGSLRRFGIDALEQRGHSVELSDLYAMDWDPVLRREQFLGPEPGACENHSGRDNACGARFDATGDVRHAFITDQLPADVAQEQDRLQRADALIVQFPLWWYGMPAMLKGWFDRVFTSGFAFGKEPETGRRLRFENGPFRGRRALVIVTAGDRPGALGPRGISGDPVDLMFGLLHGTLAYTGFDPLAPFVVPSADFLAGADSAGIEAQLDDRLSRLFTDEPLRARPQFTGDYTDDWVLRSDVAPDAHSFAAHWL